MNATEKNTYKDALNEWKTLASEDEVRLKFLSQTHGDEEKAMWMYVQSKNNNYKKLVADVKSKLISSAIYHSILRAGFWGSWLILIFGVNILLKLFYISIDSKYVIFLMIIHGAFHLYVLLLLLVALFDEWRDIKFKMICYLLIMLSFVNIGSVALDAIFEKQELHSKKWQTDQEYNKIVTASDEEEKCLSTLKHELHQVYGSFKVTYVYTPLSIRTTKNNEVWFLINVGYKDVYLDDYLKKLIVENGIGKRVFGCPREAMLNSSLAINSTWPLDNDLSSSLDSWDKYINDKYELKRKLKLIFNL